MKKTTATSFIEASYDSQRMRPWRSLILILTVFLVNARPGSVRRGLLVLGLHNHTDIAMSSWQEDSFQPDSYCWLLLGKLKSSGCPFLKLLFHSLVALPVYNFLLIMIGAERIVLVLQPIMQRSASTCPLDPLVATTTPMPPLPPPRCKRRQAPKPPPRLVRHSVTCGNSYPSQKDPFSTLHGFPNHEQYKSLRRNLKRVLEGLQQPPTPSPPQTWPLTLCNLSQITEESAQSSSTALSLELPKKKAKPPKLFRTLFKRLGKPFVKKTTQMQYEGSTVNTESNDSVNNNSNKNGIFHPIWQRLKFRSKRKPGSKQPLSSNISDSVSSSCSSRCLYAS
ncbi:uncharacterized protein LOC115758690 isoform X2 [Drosophila novamexicana]|uniref:uncharacterized protein LOC115758690 isoform X2 n=1 Tax=Drosophila novamexicana TaxID=47314 RepID=UPI0011E5A48B|nr:uncharacterized protein LOC115758690 isoform X2 [Drosophila novamexicana]